MQSRAAFREYLPIIGCYTPIHDITIREEINTYPINSDESKAFIDAQYNEVKTERRIKARLNSGDEITHKISLAVQKIYEKIHTLNTNTQTTTILVSLNLQLNSSH